MNEEVHSVIHNFYHLTGQCKYHELECCIIPEEDVYIDGWVGACIRNNLLREAENVPVAGSLTLLDVINMFPLKRGHPLYKELRESFPKGYNLHIPSSHSQFHSCVIKSGTPFHFSLILHGGFAEYYLFFIKAIQAMCRKGFGHPQVPFRLISISECDKTERLHTIYSTSSDTIFPLENPISLLDFRFCKMGDEEKELDIIFDTPMSTYNELRNPSNEAFIARQHEFPGFYPLVRAAANRVVKMMVLYHLPKELTYWREIKTLLPSYILHAATPVLLTAELQRVDVSNTPKARIPNRVRLFGYTGSTRYRGNFNYYLPLLTFARKIGVGNHATYGVGNFKLNK